MPGRAPNTLTRAWRALGSLFEPAFWLGGTTGAAGVFNPPADLRGYFEGDAGAVLSIPAINRAIGAYSDTLASLPVRILRRREELEEDTTSDAARLLAGLDFTTLEGIASSAIIHGNGFGRLEFNDRGGVSGLAWVPSGRVTPQLDEARRLWFRISRDDALGEDEALLPEAAVVHVRYKMVGAANQHLGVSPLHLCWPSLQMLLRAQALQQEIYANVSVPSLYLKSPTRVSKETVDRMRTDFKQSFGAETGRRGSTAVLTEGLEIGTVDISTAVDAQLDAVLAYCVADVARALAVPIGLLAASQTLTAGTAQSELAAFAAISLEPFCKRVARELSRKILTQQQQDSGWLVSFDVKHLLVPAGEQPARLSTLVNNGLLSLNEGRRELGLSAIDGGDSPRCPVNTSPLENWLLGNTPAQQLSHPDTPANEQPATSAPRSTLRAI